MPSTGASSTGASSAGAAVSAASVVGAGTVGGSSTVSGLMAGGIGIQELKAPVIEQEDVV